MKKPKKLKKQAKLKPKPAKARGAKLPKLRQKPKKFIGRFNQSKTKKASPAKASKKPLVLNDAAVRSRLHDILVRMNKADDRDLITLASLRDEANTLFEELEKGSPELYARYEVMCNLLKERLFRKMTGGSPGFF